MLNNLLIAALTLLGSAGLLQVNYLQLKANVAQKLIAKSWQQHQQEISKGEESTVKPWSWADFNAIARLRWQQHDIYVLSAVSGQALAFGPGHLPASARPGSGGRIIIAGHNDSHFAFLQELQTNDELSLEDAQGGNKTYKISSIDIVDSRMTKLQQAQQDELLLVTCYPFNSMSRNTPLRLVITANVFDKPERTPT